MKKITSLVTVLLVTLSVNAQDFYKFSTRTATYADLTNPTSLSNGQIWELDEFGPVNTPFPISVFGETFSIFGFVDDNFALANSNDELVYLAPISAYLRDRNITNTGSGLSPLSYKVEGTAGNRILKLEVKNAGLEMEFDDLGTSNLFLNYQVWLYENDNTIEFHFGNHNITNMNMLNDESFYWSVFLYEGTNSDEAGVVTGDINNPTYGEYDDPDQITTNLNAVPTANTVYRFEVDPLAIKDQEKVEFSMFPNPATDVLNLTFTNAVDKSYSVYDLMGREVLKGSIANVTQASIDVSTLQKGSYILRIAGSTQKFIKK